MVKLGGIVICVLIVAMDVTAGILGIQAQAAQNKVKQVRVWIVECRSKSSHEAYKLGYAAAVLIALAHAIANLLGGCICFHKASLRRQLSLVCLFVSWIIFVVGLSMLVTGTMSNKQSRASCGFTHHRLFWKGGILCFVHGFFSVAYYVSATAGASSDESKSASNA